MMGIPHIGVRAEDVHAIPISAATQPTVQTRRRPLRRMLCVSSSSAPGVGSTTSYRPALHPTGACMMVAASRSRPSGCSFNGERAAAPPRSRSSIPKPKTMAHNHGPIITRAAMGAEARRVATRPRPANSAPMSTTMT